MLWVITNVGAIIPSSTASRSQKSRRERCFILFFFFLHCKINVISGNAYRTDYYQGVTTHCMCTNQPSPGQREVLTESHKRVPACAGTQRHLALINAGIKQWWPRVKTHTLRQEVLTGRGRRRKGDPGEYMVGQGRGQRKEARRVHESSQKEGWKRVGAQNLVEKGREAQRPCPD
jgi:hypothetical protein